MKSLIVSLCAVVSAQATALVISNVGATPTQIVITYTAPTSAACTVTATDNNSGPTVNDLNPTLFTNANLDLSRTEANGYLFPTATDGLKRTVIVGGHDEIKQALDTAWYSTALQANSDHTIAVSCAGGASTGSIHISTQNVPAGSNYPELLVPKPNFRGEGSWPMPTVDWSMAGANKWYIDPISGLMTKVASHETDNNVDYPGFPYEARLFTGGGSASFVPAMDPGAQWITAGNAVIPYGGTVNAVPGLFARTSTLNAPLFLPFDADGLLQDSDFNVRLFGYSVNGTEIVRLCLSIDGGQTCATGTIDVPMSIGAKCQTYSVTTTGCEGIPNATRGVYTGSTADFPTPSLSGWGGGCKNVHCGTMELYNSNRGTITNVSVSGSVLTNNSAIKPGFNPARPAGTPYWLSGCSTGGPVALVHSATVDSYTQMTLQESGLTLSGCTLQEVGSGIRIWLTNSGTVAVAVRLYRAEGAAMSGNSSAARWFCAKQKAHVVSSKDCDGNVRTFDTQLCKLDGGGIYSLQDDGRICLQSNLFGTSNTLKAPNSPFLDGTSFLALDSGGTKMFRAVHGSDWSRYDPGSYHQLSDVNDRFIFTEMHPSPVELQANFVASSSIPANMKAAWASGQFDVTPGLNQIMDCPGVGSGIIAEWNWGTSGANGSLSMKAWTDATDGTILSGIAFWGAPHGLSSSAAHSSPQGFNCYSFSGLWSTGSPGPQAFDASQPLGGPFISRGHGLRDGSGAFHTYTVPYLTDISVSAPLNPAVMTFSSNPDLQDITSYGPALGNIQLYGSGGTGSWAALNRMVYYVRTSATTGKLYTDPRMVYPVDTSGFGPYPGGMTFTTMPPIYNLPINTVSNTGVTGVSSSGYVRLTMTFPLSVPDKYHSKLPINNADPITLPFISQSQPYFLKTGCTGCASNQFDVYTDNTLTTPLSYVPNGASIATAISNGTGWLSYAEACPDPGTIDTSWYFYDSGLLGGDGRPKVRCITVRLLSEPCSEWSTGHAESTAYPCSTNPNDQLSQLHAINVGDGFFDLRDQSNNNTERLVVLAKSAVNPPTVLFPFSTIDVVLERWYGDLPGSVGKAGACGWSMPCNAWTYSKDAGWSLMQGALDISWQVDVRTGVAGQMMTVPGHSDLGYGNVAGAYRYSGEGYPLSQPSPQYNVSMSTMFVGSTATSTALPYWAGDTTRPYFGLGENYQNCRQVPGVAAPADFVWCTNWGALNPGAGIDATSQYGEWRGSNSWTKIRGSTYDVANATSVVFIIAPLGTVDATTIKVMELLVANGGHAYFKNMSGPASLITDANVGYYCVAYKTGECRPNSTVGQVFVASRGDSDDGNGYCGVGDSFRANPCALVVPSYGGWGLQQRIDQPIRDAGTLRRLTLGWNQPMTHHGYMNAGLTADAKWALFETGPIMGHARYLANDYTPGGWWLAKLPPWPRDDSINRMTYINVTVDAAVAGAVVGDTVRARFGYGEDGGASSGFCTTRVEACWSSTTATAASPFAYGASDTQHTVTCGAVPCPIVIKAIPGRLLYYQVEVTHSGVVTTGPLTVATVDYINPATVVRRRVFGLVN